MGEEPFDHKHSKENETSAYWVYLEALGAMLHDLNHELGHALFGCVLLLELDMKSASHRDSYRGHVQDLKNSLSSIEEQVLAMREMVRTGGPQVHAERQELILSLESFDFITLPVVTRFYESKDLGDIARRISVFHAPGYAAPKMLKHTFLDIFEGRSAPFLDFYEGAFSGDDPHYEDAIVIATLILTAIGAIATPFLAAMFSESLRKKAEESRGKWD